jgi:hypothetical protein
MMRKLVLAMVAALCVLVFVPLMLWAVLYLRVLPDVVSCDLPAKTVSVEVRSVSRQPGYVVKDKVYYCTFWRHRESDEG